MIKLDFFKAANGTALTKSFYIDSDGNIDDSPYPHIRDLTSTQVAVSNIEDFYDAIKEKASQGYCLLKGNLDRDLVSESRKEHTNPSDLTEWLIIDNDYAGNISPKALMKELGINDVDYILQYSASAGIKPNKKSYHIFIKLSHACSPETLKLQIKHWNLSNPKIAKLISLRKSNQALAWPLDPVVCNNSSLIYIAPPILRDGIQDNLTVNRLQLVKGKKRHHNIDIKNLEPDVIQLLGKNKLDDLRAAADLPPKLSKTRTLSNHIIESVSDTAKVTGIKEERGFVYLNLNGGDSFGYYHPSANPKILLNFKGESNYSVRELLPAYYSQAMDKAKEYKKESKKKERHKSKNQYLQDQREKLLKAEKQKTVLHWTLRDEATDNYCTVKTDFNTMQHCVNEISSKDKISDYLIQHGGTEPELIETWQRSFSPSKPVIDINKTFINKYQLPELIRNSDRECNTIPATINRLITSVLGNNKEAFDHFINWLAVIVQKRIRTQTGWVFQGTTGTGKGLLYNYIMKPMIGDDYCQQIILSNYEEIFNRYMEECILLCVDEVDTDQIKQAPKLIAKLKNQITEPTIQIRAMRTDITSVNNHLNIIMTSNRKNSMRIESDDRRLNVAPWQNKKLLNKNENDSVFIENLKKELPDFVSYLLLFNTDINLAREYLDNDARKQLIQTTQTSIEEVANAILTGDLEYFVDLLPKDTGVIVKIVFFDHIEINIIDDFTKLIQSSIIYSDKGNKQILIHKDLFILFYYLCGKMPDTKIKLSKMLRHHGINIDRQSCDNSSKQGITVLWKKRKKTKATSKKVKSKLKACA